MSDWQVIYDAALGNYSRCMDVALTGPMEAQPLAVALVRRAPATPNKGTTVTR